MSTGVAHTESAARVVIADEHPLYREALAGLAGRAGLVLAAVIEDHRALIPALSRLQPDVALVDADMAGLDPVRLARHLEEDGIRTRVVFLSEALDPALVFDVLAAGAAGYLSKRGDAADIAASLAAAAAGETVLSPDAQGAVASEIRTRTDSSRPVLTPRESDVLRLASRGLSRSEVADELGISATTVKKHLAAVYRKLGVSTRAAAVAAALRQRLLH